MVKHEPDKIYGTTVLTLKKAGKIIVIADGQASLGNTIIKTNAVKVRRLSKNSDIIAGFAGSVADSFALIERLEMKLEVHPGQLLRACVELAKDWRTDKYLRRLESMLIVVDKVYTLVLTGNGEVLRVEDRLAAIGSGGHYALSAAKALIDIDGLNAEDVALKAMKIASEICVFTNDNFVKEVIEDE